MQVCAYMRMVAYFKWVLHKHVYHQVLHICITGCACALCATCLIEEHGVKWLTNL